MREPPHPHAVPNGGVAMRVFLTGSTGFVGRGLLSALADCGHEVVCLVRPGSEARWRPDLAWSNRVVRVPGDLFDETSLIRAMEGCDAVVHLVGIIRERPAKGVTFDRIHVDGTRRIVAAARQTGVHRLVHMSALGARPGAASPYHRTKHEAEQAVMTSGIPWTIFRPSVIFGPGDEFVNMLAQLVRLPVTPVIGDGSYRLQPVSRRTVADVFVQALTREEAIGRVFEAGGPEALPYTRILDEIGRALGKPRVRKAHIPLSLMKPAVRMMEGFPFFPITGAQLTMLLEENVCQDAEELYQTFDTPKIPFAEGIREYLRQS